MATVSVISIFPPGYFLENITATPDGGLFVTCANRQQLYYIPPASDGLRYPILVHTFPPDQWAMGIIPAPQNPNVYYHVTSDTLQQGSRTAHLHVIDTSNAATGSRPQTILTFPPETMALNGLCSLSNSTLLAADSFATCIWRVDLDLSRFPPKSAAAKVWYSHPTMAAKLVLPDFQPGANGLKYSAKTGYAYYTSTQQKLLCRVRVNPTTLEADGEAEVLARGIPGDDMIIDDNEASSAVAYVTTHRDSSIVKIPLNAESSSYPRELKDIEVVVQGSENDTRVLGPTAGVWAKSEEGKHAYFTSDGGLKHPVVDGLVRCAKVIEVKF